MHSVSMLVITEKRLVVKNINDQNYFTLSNSAMCAKLWSSGVKQVRWVDILVNFKGPRLSFFIEYCGVKTVDDRKFSFKMAQLNFVLSKTQKICCLIFVLWLMVSGLFSSLCPVSKLLNKYLNETGYFINFLSQKLNKCEFHILQRPFRIILICLLWIMKEISVLLLSVDVFWQL